MYSSKFVTTKGRKFDFGLSSGTIFDIVPLSELDVDIETSQGYDQIGETVDSEAVEGVSREITGVFVDGTDVELAQDMLDIFAPGTHGKLYYNDTYYCDCVVEKAPEMTLSNRKRTFSLMLFCPYPYWLTAESSTFQIGGYTAAFEFPVCYDSHTYGIANDSLFTNVNNTGSIPVTMAFKFTCLTEISNYGVFNVETDEMLKLDDTLAVDEEVNVYWEDGRLKVEKTTSDGDVENIFYELDEDSTLFTAASGYNILKQFADDDKADQVICYITINTAKAGIAADV